MPLNLVLILLAAFVILSIGVLVWAQGVKVQVNAAFAAFAILLSIWLILNYFSVNSTYSPELTDSLIEWILVVTSVMVLAIVVFAFLFPAKRLSDLSSFQRGILAILVAYALILISIGISNNFVESVIITSDTITPVFSAFFLLYPAYILGSITLAAYSLRQTYMTGDAKLRGDIRPILNSLLITLFGIASTNLVLVILLGNSSTISLGPIFTVFFIYYTGKAILERQLLGVRVIIGRVIYYLFVSVLPYFLFFVLANVYIVIFGTVNHPLAYLLGIIISLMFSLAFNATNEFLKKEVTTKFINPGYDPYEVVESLSKDLATTLDIKEVATSINYIIKRTIRANFQDIVLITTDKNIPGKINLSTFHGAETAQSIDYEVYKSLFIIWSEGYHDPLMYEQLSYLETTPYKNLSNWINPIKEYMARDKIRLIIPVHMKNKVQGMIIIGQKDADSSYTFQDVELLKNIANTSSLAIARSQFYQEIKEFNLSLQEKIKVATDDLRKQNGNLELALARLERIRQQEQDMLDVLGHELRTPITIVRNALSILKLQLDQSQPIPDDKLNMYVQKAFESTKREMVLIETLLAATKIDANRVQLNLEKVDMIDVVEDGMEGQKQISEERKIGIIFHKPEGDLNWFSFADRTRIQEIQDNFVSNAVKYTLKGNVEISMEKFTHPEKNIPMIKVKVKDSGIGIPKEDIPKLGRKFFRARQYIKEGDTSGAIVRPGGTGLGLYVSFELVRIMGGEVVVESELGVGSTFSYSIPAYVDQTPKHIDQTFDMDDELEQMIQDRQTAKLQAQDPLTNQPTALQPGQAKDFKQLYNANEIISKINDNKKLLEGSPEAPDSGSK